MDMGITPDVLEFQRRLLELNRITGLRPPMDDFPKLQSVFKRAKLPDGRYCVTPEIGEGMEWVFEPGVRAVEKLDGTNMSVFVRDRQIVAINNRNNQIRLFPVDSGHGESRFARGVLAAIERGWVGPLGEGQHFGELIGPHINSNRHHTLDFLWVPFAWLKEHVHWKSWIEGKYPKDFHTISEWFKELPSLAAQKLKLPAGSAEGLVFIHPDGRMAKLRRDMFEWAKGETPHGTSGDPHNRGSK